MLTVAQYAEKIGKPYPTVAAWLRKGKVEGASQIEFGGLKVWQIPENATYVEPPMGRPPKAESEDADQSAATLAEKTTKRKSGQAEAKNVAKK